MAMNASPKKDGKARWTQGLYQDGVRSRTSPRRRSRLPSGWVSSQGFVSTFFPIEPDTRRVCRAATRPDWSALEGRQDLFFDGRRGPSRQDDVAEPPPIGLVQSDRALAKGLLAGGVDGTRVPGDRVEN